MWQKLSLNRNENSSVFLTTYFHDLLELRLQFRGKTGTPSKSCTANSLNAFDTNSSCITGHSSGSLLPLRTSWLRESCIAAAMFAVKALVAPFTGFAVFVEGVKTRCWLESVMPHCSCPRHTTRRPLPVGGLLHWKGSPNVALSSAFVFPSPPSSRLCTTSSLPLNNDQTLNPTGVSFIVLAWAALACPSASVTPAPVQPPTCQPKTTTRKIAPCRLTPLLRCAITFRISDQGPPAKRSIKYSKRLQALLRTIILIAAHQRLWSQCPIYLLANKRSWRVSSFYDREGRRLAERSLVRRLWRAVRSSNSSIFTSRSRSPMAQAPCPRPPRPSEPTEARAP